MAKHVKPDHTPATVELGWKDKRNPFDVENRDYDFDESYRPWDESQGHRAIHTTQDLVRALEADKTGKRVTVEAKVFGVKNGEARLMRLNREKFLAAAKSKARTFREGIDYFSYDNTGMGGDIGQDYTPLLGGPFSKQLYYVDYIKAHQAAFFAYHHDPVARRLVNIVKQFTLGRGFRTDATGPDEKKALALWDAFCEANHMDELVDHLAIEMSLYGEIMLYWLPQMQSRITWRVPDAEIPRGLIPRVRLIDPSTIWEIITYPEDISRVIAYQQIFPTQWQTYTANGVPGTKFIYQQLPADDVMHFKVNSVSNEKRGRSDLFPVLSYLKRLRDAVNYSLVAEMKNSAWCIDTTIEGGAADIAAYIKSQQALGTIPAAGSEFVHSKKVTREYRSNGASGSHANPVFEWCLSMVAIGSGIPTTYFGTHLSSGQTRGSSIVATEPVAKVFEDRQAVYERVLKAVWKRLMSRYGLRAEVDFTFPEIITQDRSAKLKDLALAQSEGWFSTKRVAGIAAQEFGVDDFDYDAEKLDTEIGVPGQLPPIMGGSPLTDPAGANGAKSPAAAPGLGAPAGTSQPKSNGGIAGDERSSIKKDGTGQP